MEATQTASMLGGQKAAGGIVRILPSVRWLGFHDDEGWGHKKKWAHGSTASIWLGFDLLNFAFEVEIIYG